MLKSFESGGLSQGGEFRESGSYICQHNYSGSFLENRTYLRNAIFHCKMANKYCRDLLRRRIRTRTAHICVYIYIYVIYVITYIYIYIYIYISKHDGRAPAEAEV